MKINEAFTTSENHALTGIFLSPHFPANFHDGKVVELFDHYEQSCELGYLHSELIQDLVRIFHETNVKSLVVHLPFSFHQTVVVRWLEEGTGEGRSCNEIVRIKVKKWWQI